MAYLKSSEGLGIKPQRIKLADDTRTATQAGAGALRWNTTASKTQVVSEGNWIDMSQDPSYTAGGNFIGDGSDG
jgi:hypothetical protein